MKRIISVILIITAIISLLPASVLAAPKELGEYVINASTLNVRAEPTSKSTLLGVLKMGDKVNVTEIANEYWGRIDFEGKEAWISLNYAVSSAAKQYSMSEAGLNMLKSLEGYYQYAYWDYSQWSIGYGTACGENEYPNGITEPEASALLVKALAVYEAYLDIFLANNSIKVTQSQYDALVSFTYNLGNIWIRSKDFSLRTILINGIKGYTETDIKDAFGEFVSAGGQVLSGLVKRREKEAQMFISGTLFDGDAECIHEYSTRLYPPTFKEKGREILYCELCGKIFAEDVINELHNPFTDVKIEAWYSDSLAYCIQRGYVSGVSKNSFMPNSTLTRAQFVMMLAMLDGAELSVYTDTPSGFDDVKPNHWYHTAVTWAAQNGYVSGMSQTSFAPNSNVTRQQLARMFWVYAQDNGYDMTSNADLTVFEDESKIAYWATEGVTWAVSKGIISGMSETTLIPGGNATRAQAARMLMVFDEIK